MFKLLIKYIEEKCKKANVLRIDKEYKKAKLATLSGIFKSCDSIKKEVNILFFNSSIFYSLLEVNAHICQNLRLSRRAMVYFKLVIKSMWKNNR